MLLDLFVDLKELLGGLLNFVLDGFFTNAVLKLNIGNLLLHLSSGVCVSFIASGLVLISLSESSNFSLFGGNHSIVKSFDGSISNLGSNLGLLGDLFLEFSFVALHAVLHVLGSLVVSFILGIDIGGGLVPLGGLVTSMEFIKTLLVFFFVLIHFVLNVVELLCELSLLGNSVFHHLLNLGHFVATIVSGFCGEGSPVGLQVKLTSALSFVLDSEPLVPVGLNAEGGEFCLTISDFLVSASILVLGNEGEVVSEVLDIDVKLCTLPLGGLGTVFAGL